MKQGYALITGASEGMGREFAGLFARDGYPLILVARNKARLETLAAELKAAGSADIRTVPLDLSRPAAAEELKAVIDAQKLEVAVLVNNAGAGVHGFFKDADLKTTEDMLRLNMTTLTHLTRLFLPAMVQKSCGKILNVASTAAFQPGPLMACYFASKAYVLSFTEALADELSGTGVTVTAFCPGPVKTLFQERSGTADIRENAFAMDAAKAAAAAYRGLMRGKTLVVPGAMNKLLAFLVRLAPRRLVIRATRFLEEKR